MEYLKKSKFFASAVLIGIAGIVIWIYSNILFVFRPLEALFSSIFLPLLIATFVYYIFLPLFHLIERIIKKKIISVGLIMLIIFYVAYIIVQVIVPDLINETARFIGQVPYLVQRIAESLDHSIVEDFVGPSVNALDFQQISNFTVQFITGATNSLTSIVSIISHSAILLFTIPLLLLYMFKDGHKLPAVMTKVTPKKYKVLVRTLCTDFHASASAYIGGKLLVSSYVFVCSFILFSFLGLQNPLLLALICGVLDIIPYFGPFIGAAPALLFALGQDMNAAIILVVGIVILQLGESYLVSPLVMKKVLHIHPIVAVFLLLIAGNLLGFVGMIVALPIYSIAAAMCRTLFNYWQQNKLVRQSQEVPAHDFENN